MTVFLSTRGRGGILPLLDHYKPHLEQESHQLGGTVAPQNDLAGMAVQQTALVFAVGVALGTEKWLEWSEAAELVPHKQQPFVAVVVASLFFVAPVEEEAAAVCLV